MSNSSRSDERLVQVATAPNEIMAELWSGALESEGIRVLTRPLGPGGAYFTTFVTQHALLVLESDAVRAAEVLDSLTNGDDEI